MSLVRALKASNSAHDARNAFHANPATNAQVVGEWCVLRLSREGTGLGEVWSVLAEVLDSRTRVKLNIDICRVLTRFFEDTNNDDDIHDETHVLAVRKCLSSLWAHHSQRTSPEALLDCFSAFLLSLKTKPKNTPSFIALGRYPAQTLKSTLSNKKRAASLASTFLSGTGTRGRQHFSTLLTSSPPDEFLHIGTEILFNADALRSSVSPSTLSSHLASVLTESQNPDAVLTVLPKLVSAYIHALKRHQKQSWQTSVAEFLENAFRVLLDDTKDVRTWKAKGALLGVAEEQHVVTSGIVDANGAVALAALESSDNDISNEASTSLTILLRSAFDDTASLVPFIIQSLSRLPPTSAHESLLTTLLSHHSKSRSLGLYMAHIYSALSSSTLPSSTSSAVLSSAHTHALQHALSIYLPSGQIIPFVEGLLAPLRDAISESPEDQVEERPKKKRRVSPPTSPPTSSSTKTSAAGLAALIHIASHILLSLPVHTLAPSMRPHLADMLLTFHGDVLVTGMERALGVLTSEDKREGEEGERLTAMLRLHHTFVTARNLHLDLPIPEPVDRKKLFSLVSSSTNMRVSSGLKVEIFRYLLHSPSSEAAPTVDDTTRVLLDCLFSSYPGTPNGDDTETETDELLHLINRYIPTIDQNASPTQLSRFTSLLLSLCPGPTSGTERILRNAQFYEMHNVRSAFLNMLSLPPADRGRGKAYYSTLLLLPAEYVGKSKMGEILVRAVEEELGSSSEDGMDVDDEDGDREEKEARRLFVARALASSGERGGEVDAKTLLRYLNYILASPSLELGLEEDLVDQLVTSIAKDPPTFAKLLSSFSSTDADSTSHFTALRSAVSVLEKTSLAITDEISEALKRLARGMEDRFGVRVAALSSSSGENEGSDVKTLLKAWHVFLRIRVLLHHDDGDVPKYGRKLVRLGETVKEEVFEVLVEEFRFLCLADEKEREKEKKEHLDIVLAAYVHFASEAETKLDTHLARLCKSLTPDDFAYLLSFVLDSLTSLSYPDPAAKSMETERVISLLNFAGVVLACHPQRTMKQMQTFVTGCVYLFVDAPVFHSSSGSQELRLTMLKFVAKHCSDRPAALLPQNLGPIMSLLAKLLLPVPSLEHEAHTNPTLFHAAISTLSALVRLRRDLVLGVLPHLGMVLGLLLGALRRCSGAAGGAGEKQRKAVEGMLPAFVRVNEPLGREEARAVARLLEGLGTKTVVRSFFSSSSSHQDAGEGRTDSLSRPFSKHAVYVLRAYISSLTSSPLATLPQEVRTELKPGIHALCGMIGEHSRDALMVGGGLDASGKALLKEVWREWERVRYVGKG